MAQVTLKAEPRERTGKGGARQARARGKVPAIVYGRGIDPVAIEVDGRELVTAFHTDAGTNVLLEIHVDGQELLAITRDLQRDPVKGTVLHADFVKVDRERKIDVEVPIHVVGEARGAKAGGVLEQPLFQIAVTCLPTQVPEAIDADVSALDIGEQLRVADLSAPEGVELTTDPGTVVAAVAHAITDEEIEQMTAAAGVDQEAPEAAAAEADKVDVGPDEVTEEPKADTESGPSAAHE